MDGEAAWKTCLNRAHTKSGGVSRVKTSEVSVRPFSGSKIAPTDVFGRARHRVNLRGLLLPQLVNAPIRTGILFVQDNLGIRLDILLSDYENAVGVVRRQGNALDDATLVAEYRRLRESWLTL